MLSDPDVCETVAVSTDNVADPVGPFSRSELVDTACCGSTIVPADGDASVGAESPVLCADVSLPAFPCSGIALCVGPDPPSTDADACPTLVSADEDGASEVVV